MEILIDVSGICSADEFYELLGTKIELPAYFGNNLDALSDVLDEQPKGSQLRIKNLGEMEVLMPKFVRALRRMSEKMPERLVCE